MTKGLWIGVLGMLGACANPKSPPALEPIVTVVHDTDDVVDVKPTGPNDPGYVVTFAKAKGFPSQLQYNGQQLLQSGDCPFESLIGVAVFPGVVVAGEIPEDANAHVAFDLEGPVVAHATFEYMHPYMCNGDNHVLTGTSSFTFFPLGRIVRHDEVTANTGLLTASPSMCGCNNQSDNNYFFTSYWAFLPAAQRKAPDDSDLAVEENDYNQAAACFVYNAPATSIAVRYDNGNPQTRVLTMLGITSQRFVYDFRRAVATIDPADHGSVTSAIQLTTQPTPCSQLVASLEDRGLRIDDRAAPSDDAGIYTDTEGNYGRTVKITGSGAPIAPGFVVSLRGVFEHIRVDRPNTDGVYYLPQLDTTNGRTLLWFRDALADGESIEIELLD